MNVFMNSNYFEITMIGIFMLCIISCGISHFVNIINTRIETKNILVLSEKFVNSDNVLEPPETVIVNPEIDDTEEHSLPTYGQIFNHN